MSGAKHTPGPWTFRGPERIHEADPGIDAYHDLWRASADRGDESKGAFIEVDASTEALALVAVHAPMLLEALEAAELLLSIPADRIDKSNHVWTIKRIRQAIAAARLESPTSQEKS